jgi:hypothetical protein
MSRAQSRIDQPLSHLFNHVVGTFSDTKVVLHPRGTTKM